METMLVTRPVRVVLADDHPMIRRGLRLILEDSDEVDGVAEAGNGQALLDLVDQMDPDVAVVDVCMPKLDGLEAVRRIRDRRPGIKARCFSVPEEAAYVHRARL